MISNDERGYLNQFLSEMRDSFQKGSTRCAPQYEHINFVGMKHTGFQTSLIFKAICWPSLARYFDICQWWLICMIHHAYVRTSLWLPQMFFELNIAKKYWILAGEIGKERVAMRTKIFTAVGVLPAFPVGYGLYVGRVALMLDWCKQLFRAEYFSLVPFLGLMPRWDNLGISPHCNLPFKNYLYLYFQRVCRRNKSPWDVKRTAGNELKPYLLFS